MLAGATREALLYGFGLFLEATSGQDTEQRQRDDQLPE